MPEQEEEASFYKSFARIKNIQNIILLADYASWNNTALVIVTMRW